MAEVRNKCNAYIIRGPDPIAEFQTGIYNIYNMYNCIYIYTHIYIMSNVSMCYNCVLVASTCHIFVQILRSSRCSVRGRQFPQKKNYPHVFYCTYYSTYYRIFDIEDINKNITSWSVAFAIMAMWFWKHYVTLEFGKIHGNHQPLVAFEDKLNLKVQQHGHFDRAQQHRETRARCPCASNGFIELWNIPTANVIRIF